MITYILIVFLVSIGSTGVLRHYALRRGIIDTPNERSSHTIPTPRGGGVSFVITFLTALTAAYLFNITDAAPQTKPFMALITSGLLVAGIGFWDDHIHIPARWRFLTHSIAALIGLLLLGLPEIPLPSTTINLGLLGYPIGIIALVWLLNLFNFMDGIDGFAGSEALFVGISATIIMMLAKPGEFSAPILWLSILMAGVAGFIVWNWPPAKIFMGDAGSGFLGLMLGLFALWSANLGLSIWCWIILLALFITDATVTLLRRMLSGERWFEAHRSHLYQQLSRKWGNHRSVTQALISLNVFWLFPWAWLAATYHNLGLFITFTAYLPIVVLARKLGAGKPGQYE
jgi:Fuc2NAc and GlcNAc transferase